eukprot:6491537-Amphidinium_carterae.5
MKVHALLFALDSSQRQGISMYLWFWLRMHAFRKTGKLSHSAHMFSVALPFLNIVPDKDGKSKEAKWARDRTSRVSEAIKDFEHDVETIAKSLRQCMDAATQTREKVLLN